MLNRRILRIKIFQALYAYWQDEQPAATAYEKILFKNIERAYELYLFNLAFFAELKFFIEKELDIQQAKHYPSQQQIDILHALNGNKVLGLIASNEILQQKLKAAKLVFADGKDVLRSAVQNVILKHKAFEDYTNQASKTLQHDNRILVDLFELLVMESDTFNQFMEERFLNWEDDLVLLTLAMQKTFQHIKSNQTDFTIEFYKDKSEEQQFLHDLFNRTIEYNDEITALISAKTKNWDADRLALVDIILMKMALCEIIYFPQIPIKVSINEYLELAKLYSTPNSSGFINGVLDKIQIDLKHENKISKLGRGLVE